MKALVCEMCNSNDLVKQDGYFVCQNCGTKYSVEEAKKMMIDGTVDVSGSQITIDNSSSVSKYMQIAENAYKAKNYKEAEEYCNKIIEIDSVSHYAWHIKGKAAGWQSTLGHPRLEETVNCFINAIDMADEETKAVYINTSSNLFGDIADALMELCLKNFRRYPSDENYKEISKIEKYILSLANRLTQKTGNTNFYNTLKHNVFADEFRAAQDAYFNYIKVEMDNEYKKLMEEIDAKNSIYFHPSQIAFDKYFEQSERCTNLILNAIKHIDNKEELIVIYKELIRIEDKLCGAYHATGRDKQLVHLSLAQQNNRKQRIQDYHMKIKELDPNYTVPPISTPNSNNNSSSGGCYVATCVYGSYDCPQVWTLRRYRDYQLAETWYGRAFIKTYYAISPTLVKWFGNTDWFKNMWRGTLDRMVSNLQADGVENTPYIDKEW